MTLEKVNAAIAYVESVEGVGEKEVTLTTSFVMELLAFAKQTLLAPPTDSS